MYQLPSDLPELVQLSDRRRMAMPPSEMTSVQFIAMGVATGQARKALADIPAGSFVYTKQLPGSPSAVSAAVRQARRRGEVVRIRRGLYFKGIRTRYGPTRPDSETVVYEILGRIGVGPTGFSAARALGLTTQVPAKPVFAVVGSSSPAVPGVTLSRRSNMRRRSLWALEIATLELLRGDWETTVDGGWLAFTTAVAARLTDASLRWRCILYAAAGERSVSLRRNLARLTDDLHEFGLLAQS